MYLPYVQEVLNTYYIVSDYIEWGKTSWTCSVHLLFGISVVGAVRSITGRPHSEFRVERWNEFMQFYAQDFTKDMMSGFGPTISYHQKNTLKITKKNARAVLHL